MEVFENAEGVQREQLSDWLHSITGIVSEVVDPKQRTERQEEEKTEENTEGDWDTQYDAVSTADR